MRVYEILGLTGTAVVFVLIALFLNSLSPHSQLRGRLPRNNSNRLSTFLHVPFLVRELTRCYGQVQVFFGS